MIKNTTTIGELKKGQQFKTKYGTFECVNPYWPEARNAAYRAAKIAVITSTVNIPKGNLVVFNHRTKVELI